MPLIVNDCHEVPLVQKLALRWELERKEKKNRLHVERPHIKQLLEGIAIPYEACTKPKKKVRLQPHIQAGVCEEGALT